MHGMLHAREAPVADERGDQVRQRVRYLEEAIETDAIGLSMFFAKQQDSLWRKESKRCQVLRKHQLPFPVRAHSRVLRRPTYFAPRRKLALKPIDVSLWWWRRRSVKPNQACAAPEHMITTLGVAKMLSNFTGCRVVVNG